MAKNLEEAIRQAGSPVKLLWESKTPPAIVPRVVPEFTNWRDEQLAWRRTSVLYDQSHHMADLNIKGPDALKLIGKLAVNSVASFPVDMAKQFVAVNYDGYVIGDNILFHLEEDEYQAFRRRSTGCTITPPRVATTCASGATTTRSIGRATRCCGGTRCRVRAR
jgi:glycine cleavage system aminomethyltransferase T